MDLLENCDDCYQFNISEFPSSLIIKAGLEISTWYILKVIDKFGNRFSSVPTVSSGAGVLTIAIGNSFPAQMFNRNAGSFRLELSKTAQPWTPVTVTFATVPYECILVECVNDASNINTIQ